MPAVPRDRLRLVHHGVDHTEGIAISPDGSVWCGGEEGQIYRSPLEGPPTEIARLPARPLGFTLDADGNAYCCGSSETEPAVYRITPGGDVARISTGSPDRRCIAPNHPAFLPDGTLLFTDSGNWRQDDGCIFAVRPDGAATVADTSACRCPNGLATSPDGSVVAVVESTLPGISALTVGPDGRLRDRRVLARFQDATPDGVVFDAAGRLLVSCFRPDVVFLVDGDSVDVLVSDPERALLNSPTNLAFVPGTSTVVCTNYGERCLTTFEHETMGAVVPSPLFAWAGRRS